MVAVREVIGSGDSELTLECSRALCCHERALFYATNVKEDPITTIVKNSGSDPVKLITNLYKESGNLLATRLTGVSEKYDAVKNKKFLFFIPLGLGSSDRDASSITHSREILTNRITWLCEEIDEDRNKAIIDGKAATSDNYKEGWASLHSMCELLMDEISHLGKRIGELNGTRATIRAFSIAVFSAFLSIAALTKDWWWSKLLFDDKESPPLVGQSGSGNGANAANVQTTVEISFKEGTLTSEFKDLAEVIPKLTKSIDDHAKSMSDSSPNSLSARLNELNESVSKIGPIIEKSQSPLTADNITTLNSHFDEISKSLGQIGPAIANQKAPIVNVSPRIEIKAPSQPLPTPDKKTIGLINIDASKVGASETEKPEQPEKDRARLKAPHR